MEIEAGGATPVTDKLKRFRNVMGGLPDTFGVLRGVNASREHGCGICVIIIAGTALGQVS